MAIDYSPVLGSVDVASLIVALFAVGALLAVVALAVMGVRKVIATIHADDDYRQSVEWQDAMDTIERRKSRGTW